MVKLIHHQNPTDMTLDFGPYGDFKERGHHLNSNQLSSTQIATYRTSPYHHRCVPPIAT